MPHPFEAFQPTTGRYHGDNTDLVTRVPLRAMGYSHAGTLLHFGDKGKLTSDPDRWYALLNRMQGRLDDLLDLFGLFNMALADLRQHSIDHHVKLCEKNRAVHPF